MKKIILIFSTLFPVFCLAQYGNVWCMGFHHGINFNTIPPSHFDTSSVFTNGGSASVCDINGQLLFYTDGGRVWDKLHQQMPNGYSMGYAPSFFYDTISMDSLRISATQTAVILPIENSTKYYIFTVDFRSSSSHSLKYHIIDMTVNNGLGDVVLKNQILANGFSEKLTATRHCNGQDWWVVARKRDGDEYFSYLVTPDSVISMPLISHTNVTSNSSECCGNTKISPNGKWLSSSYGSYGGIELAKFNNSNGSIEILWQDFLPSWKTGYGIAFSGDSRYLYGATQVQDSIPDSTGNNSLYNNIDRYFLDSMDSLQILQSKTQLLHTDSMRNFTSLQLAPDGNIYGRGDIYDPSLDIFIRSELFTIKPDSDSLSPTPFIYYPIPFVGWPWGLPSFPDAIFTNHHKASLRIPTCVAGVFDSIPFFDSLLTVTRDYLWNFGDPASGVNNTFDGQFPIHAFSSPGIYTVTLTLPSDCNPITITQQVIANPTSAITPVITLNSFYLESTPSAQYQWYLNNNLIAGATSQSYTPTANGDYTVTITDSNNCTQTSFVFNLTNVGIRTSNNPLNFSIYPNPANQLIQINNPTQKQTTFTITDLVGNIIIKKNINKSTESINIAQLSNGIYLITIDDVFNQKLVVNH
jgi:hypothetical protein